LVTHLTQKRPKGCRNSSRVFAQTFGTVHNISQVNLIMADLKNDETPVEKLYEDINGLSNQSFFLEISCTRR